MEGCRAILHPDRYGARRLAGLLMGLLFPVAASAQTVVTGSVVDSSGAALPGVSVTISGGGSTHFSTSGGDGHFRLQGIPPGTYKVTFELGGFSTLVKEGVSVASTTLDLGSATLQIAPMGERIVVTPSRIESTSVMDSPASISVITDKTIENSPATNYGDLLREVPGLNVIQLTARDINLTSREGTSTLSNSELVLLDGRSIYLDFFGLVLWDFVPTNPAEIKQIEVVRGPASAVWGANALTGVVNIITKSPREMAAESTNGSITLQGGAFSRDAGSTVGQGSGGDYGGHFTFAHVMNDQWSLRVCGGYFQSDAFPRPSGQIPFVANPTNPAEIDGGGIYPPFKNTATKQPKFDARVDQELTNGGRITYDAGYAGTSGIIHTGIGPFDIQSGSYLAYGRVGYTQSGFKLAGFFNYVDTTAPNLLQIDPSTGLPLQLNFKTQTYDLEAGNVQAFGSHNVLSYGGNARRNVFNITLAPHGQDRNEFGAYLQDEILVDKFRLTLGGRVDKFGNLDSAVFSPRVSAIFKPTKDHSLRVSFNKAFRAPSFINNYLDIHTVVPVDLSGLAPFLPPFLAPLVEKPFDLVAHSVGSEVRRGENPAEVQLKEESIKAWEAGYTGNFGGKTTVELVFYQNDHDNPINFVTDPLVQEQYGITGAIYGPQNPPPGWVLPPILLGLLAQNGTPLPAQFTYMNLGPYREKGIEASVDQAFTRALTGFANYSYQSKPVVLPATIPYPASKLAPPATNRFNAGLNYSDHRYLGSVSVNYSDKAYWTDVLTNAYHGYTDSYTMLNASFGIKWNDGKIVTSVKGTNLANNNIQQHIFGDIIKRNIFGEVRFLF